MKYEMQILRFRWGRILMTVFKRHGLSDGLPLFLKEAFRVPAISLGDICATHLLHVFYACFKSRPTVEHLSDVCWRF